MMEETTYALVKIVKGVNEDAHIIFDREDEGFHIGLMRHGTDSLKTFICTGNNVTVWKTYTGALKAAEKYVGQN